MGPIDGYSCRIYWAIANLASSIFICLPLTWGLAREQSLKFMAAATGTALAVNAARLINLHDRGAPIRMAWQEAGQMVSAAWIEDISLANLPPSIRQATYVGAETENYHLPQLPPPITDYQLPITNSQLPTIAENQQTEQPPERGSDRKMPNLSNYPAVLIYGVHGSGKTTFSEWEVQKRLSLGHEVIVLDPHAAYGKWKGCKIIGDGMDYKAINEKLKWLFAEIKNRYSRTKAEPNPHLPPLTFVAEEFTQWSRKVELSGELFWAANTDIRKVKIFILFVNHTRNLVGLGNAKGAGKLRDDSLLEVELRGEMDEQTGEAAPLFQALVKMPGKPLSERYLVPIDRIYGKLQPQKQEASGSEPRSSIEALQSELEKPRSPYGIPDSGLEAFLVEILNGNGNATVFSSELGLEHSQKLYLARLLIDRKLGVEKTIFYLWGIKSGGANHYKYVEARQWLNRLIEEISRLGE